MKIYKYFILSLLINNINCLICPSNFLHNHPNLAINTIEFLTNKLPMLDTFGHKNLEFNQKVIPIILKNNDLPTKVKVKIVTDLIKFSQNGDNFGGFIIENYLKIITYITNSL